MAHQAFGLLLLMQQYHLIPLYTGVSAIFLFLTLFLTLYLIDMAILRGCLGYGGAAVSFLPQKLVVSDILIAVLLLV